MLTLIDPELIEIPLEHLTRKMQINIRDRMSEIGARNYSNYPHVVLVPNKGVSSRIDINGAPERMIAQGSTTCHSRNKSPKTSDL